ncbi:hypothetical protein VTO42DRAFT_128 [Malbranchea cinnamomea]
MLHARIKPLPTHTHNNVPFQSNVDEKEQQRQHQEDNAEDHEDEEDLDVFTSFLPHLFPDEAPSCLGDPGKTLLYSSPLYGDLRVVVPGYPAQQEQQSRAAGEGEAANGINGSSNVSGSDSASYSAGDVEEGRRLFAHYLWGGAMVVAEGIEEADRLRRSGRFDAGSSGTGGREDELLVSRRRKWDVKGQKVLELGAGAALPSLIAALAGADAIAITDHPSSSALYGPIQTTIFGNLSLKEAHERISIHPHEWGMLPASCESNTTSQNGSGSSVPSEVGNAALQFAAANKGGFTRIICADCLWMSDQHDNLIRSLLWFLAPLRSPTDPSETVPGKDAGGVAWVVAGFHTGRAVVASFFEKAVSAGLVVEDIWERDMNATSEEGEVTRAWRPVRDDEGPENRARWCVVALLRKKE